MKISSPRWYSSRQPDSAFLSAEGKGQKVILKKRVAQFLAMVCAFAVSAPVWAARRDQQWIHSMTAGQLAYEAGRYGEAVRQLKIALARAEKFGPKDMRLASTLNRLAQVYHDQGEYTKAEPLYRRSLALSERALGPSHPDVAANMNNLATLYRDEGEYTRAEALYRRSLGIVRRALGPESTDAAISLNNLAEVYSDQEKYAEAEPLYKKSLEIWEKNLGPQDMNVAVGLNNLGALYDNEKKYAEAEKQYKRALAIKEVNLGPSDPSIALSLSNLGKVYVADGKFKEAQPVLYRALTILHWPLEGNSSAVAGRALDHLATFYRAQGKYDLAEYYYMKSLDVTEKAQGPRHPNVARTMLDYAVLLRETHRPAEAQKMEASAAAIQAAGTRAAKAPARRARSRQTRRTRAKRITRRKPHR
jgi:tetratricopeptide (TPR) repeat protein